MTKIPSIIKRYSDKPWLAWLIVCLCRQQERQAWHLSIHKKIEHLNEYEGKVPDMPEWSFDYHGNGLCLVGPNDEVLDVNFEDDEAKTIDPYFFANRVIYLNKVQLPEERLRKWLPKSQLIAVAINELQKSGILRPEDSHTFYLNPQFYIDWQEIINANFDDGDISAEWYLNIEGVKTEEENSSTTIERYYDWLEDLLNHPKLGSSLVDHVTECLSPERQLKICLGQISGPICHNTAGAIETLHKRKDAPTELIEDLVSKLNSKKHHPYIAWQVCRFLLSRNIMFDECINTLETFSKQRVVDGYSGNPYDYELALLCLTYAPKQGHQLLRTALRSKTPAAIEDVSALLALIDEPWSRLEVINALTDGTHLDDTPAQRMLSATLIHSSDLETQKKGKELMPPERIRDEGEFGYTFDEVVATSLEESFPLSMESARKDLEMLDLEKIRNEWEPPPKKSLLNWFNKN